MVWTVPGLEVGLQPLSPKATALAAITCISGGLLVKPGKTAELIFLPFLAAIRLTRLPCGARSVLCVVVVTKFPAKWDRADVLAGGDEPGDVGHIDHKQGADFLADFLEPGKLDLGVIALALCGDDQFRFRCRRQLGDLIEINPFVGLADAP